MILAEKIMELRKKNGWSQEELAEKIHVSRQSVSKWESSASIPDLSKILLLSQVFGVSIAMTEPLEFHVVVRRGFVAFLASQRHHPPVAGLRVADALRVIDVAVLVVKVEALHDRSLVG